MWFVDVVLGVVILVILVTVGAILVLCGAWILNNRKESLQIGGFLVLAYFVGRFLRLSGF